MVIIHKNDHENFWKTVYFISVKNLDYIFIEYLFYSFCENLSGGIFTPLKDYCFNSDYYSDEYVSYKIKGIQKKYFKLKIRRQAF